MKTRTHKTPAFAINLPYRTDRRNHIIKEFEGRDEFDLTIVNAIEHKVGAIGLLQSFQYIVKLALQKKHDYVLVCEDDHHFTTAYNSKDFIEKVSLGAKKGFDILLGGVSGFHGALHYKDNLFWLEEFTGTQFLVIYKKFYKKSLTICLQDNEHMDIKMNSYTDNIFAFYPQISVQKNFDYSDVTRKNNQNNVEEYFKRTDDKFSFLQSVLSYYQALSSNS